MSFAFSNSKKLGVPVIRDDQYRVPTHEPYTGSRIPEP